MENTTTDTAVIGGHVRYALRGDDGNGEGYQPRLAELRKGLASDPSS